MRNLPNHIFQMFITAIDYCSLFQFRYFRFWKFHEICWISIYYKWFFFYFLCQIIAAIIVPTIHHIILWISYFIGNCERSQKQAQNPYNFPVSKIRFCFSIHQKIAPLMRLPSCIILTWIKHTKYTNGFFTKNDILPYVSNGNRMVKKAPNWGLFFGDKNFIFTYLYVVCLIIFMNESIPMRFYHTCLFFDIRVSIQFLIFLLVYAKCVVWFYW